jgi:hypothetical protein
MFAIAAIVIAEMYPVIVQLVLQVKKYSLSLRELNMS